MKKKVGRPTKFDPKMLKQARKACLLGATNEDLAELLAVAPSTISKWLAEVPEFSEAVKAAKEELDSTVVRRLFERATGYSHPDVHVSNYQGAVTMTPITKHYAPDTTAAIFWLKNRQPELWRDRTEHTGANGAPLVPNAPMDNLELARRMAFILSEAEGAIDKASESSRKAVNA